MNIQQQQQQQDALLWQAYFAGQQQATALRVQPVFLVQNVVNRQQQQQQINICPYYETSRCKHGISGQENGQCRRFHPSSLCKNLRESGRCNRGDYCKFLHPHGVGRSWYCPPTATLNASAPEFKSRLQAPVEVIAVSSEFKEESTAPIFATPAVVDKVSDEAWTQLEVALTRAADESRLAQQYDRELEEIIEKAAAEERARFDRAVQEAELKRRAEEKAAATLRDSIFKLAGYKPSTIEDMEAAERKRLDRQVEEEKAQAKNAAEEEERKKLLAAEEERVSKQKEAKEAKARLLKEAKEAKAAAVAEEIRLQQVAKEEEVRALKAARDAELERKRLQKAAEAAERQRLKEFEEAERKRLMVEKNAAALRDSIFKAAGYKP